MYPDGHSFLLEAMDEKVHFLSGGKGEKDPFTRNLTKNI